MNSEDLDFGATLRGFANGQHVFGRYILTRQLGRGGMGVVWLAHDEKLDTDVALKFLPEAVSSDEESVCDLKRETRRALKLTHPRIVRIFDFVEDGRCACISMEFVDGRTMTSLKLGQPDGFFEVETIAPWMRQLCEALAYAHGEAQIVHRDLKPANLMLDSKGNLKVTDFGISATLSDTTTRTSRLASATSGTPVYMSPQQMMGDKPLPTDDIYSFGVTVFELLTGKPPFYNGNIPIQVQNKLAPGVSERRDEFGFQGVAIPECWEKAIAACLSKAAEDRPQSIPELARMLQLGDIGSVPAVSSPTAGVKCVFPASAKSPAVPGHSHAVGDFFRKKKWWLAAVVLAAVGLVVWKGDISNRIKARRAYKDAIESGQPVGSYAAITSLQRAANLRPETELYSTQYAAQQDAYLDDFAVKLSGMDPKPAYDLAQEERGVALPILDVAHVRKYERIVASAGDRLGQWVENGLNEAAVYANSGEFDKAYASVNDVEAGKDNYPDFSRVVDGIKASNVRWVMRDAANLASKNDYDAALNKLSSVSSLSNLVPEYATLLTTTRENQVRYDIASAKKLADQNNFEDALARLDVAAGRGVIPEAVQVARGEVSQRIKLVCIEELSDALLRQNLSQIQSVIDRMGNLTGRTFKTSAADLGKTKDLSIFVDQLQELGVRQPDNKDSHFDLVIIKSLAGKFDDPAKVHDFLSEEYMKWSRTMADKHMPGCALYLQSMANAENGSGNDVYKKKLTDQAAAALGATVDFQNPTSEDSSSRLYASNLQNTLINGLTGNCTSWLRVSSSRQYDPVSISLKLSRLDTQHDKQESSSSVRYQSGTRTVDNPDYRTAESDVRYAEDNFQSASEENSRASSAAIGATGNDAIIASSNSLAASTRLIAASVRLSKARDNLNNTPSTIEEPVYDTERYRIIDHNLNHTMTVTINFSLGGQVVEQPLAWVASKNESSREVIGNASHGVPVRRLDLMDRRSVLDVLVGQLNAVMEDPSLKSTLIESLYQQAQRRAEKLKMEGLARTDLLWSLRELWVQSGNAFPYDSELRSQMREGLGLPATE